MSKFKKKIATTKKEKKSRDKQQELKKKYKLHNNENVLIVEKSNMIKFSIRLIANLIRLICTIAILVLAAFGLLTWVYPETRLDMVNVLNDLYLQFKMFTGL